jgi:hypothetical protein
MLPQKVFYISHYLFAAFIAAAPSPNPDFDDSHLPSLRLSREEVQAMKEGQIYPSGYIHTYITFGEGSDALSVPIVEVDPNILLDDEDGVRARSLASRDGGSFCSSFFTPFGSCTINYCWSVNGVIYSEALTITGSNGQSNPSNVASSNDANLSLDPNLNNGYNGWFPQGHACSNSNTQIYTDHLLQDGTSGTALINNLQCDACLFSGLTCLTTSLQSNMGAWSNGVPLRARC